MVASAISINFIIFYKVLNVHNVISFFSSSFSSFFKKVILFPVMLEK